jgi:tryptophan 2,3-dioxygenase
MSKKKSKTKVIETSKQTAELTERPKDGFYLTFDLEYHFQRWRFGHLKTVERIIGFKRGTGGTPGVPYLEGVLKQAFFPELLTVRTAI